MSNSSLRWPLHEINAARMKEPCNRRKLFVCYLFLPSYVVFSSKVLLESAPRREYLYGLSDGPDSSFEIQGETPQVTALE